MSQRNESSLYSLAHRETIALADRRSFNLTCTAGELWVTADSLAGDHLLKAGEQMTLASHTRVVVSALKAAEMEAKLAAMDPEKAAKVRAALAAKAARDKQKKEA